MTGVTSSTISVQWESVPCRDQNGDITGYSVQYGLMGSGEKPVTMSVSGGSKTEATLSNLTAETSYWITVAAVNTEGTGDSTNISAKTSAGIVTYHYCAHVELTKNGVCIPIKESTTTSSIGAAVVAPTAGSVIGFLLLLSVIVFSLILFIRYCISLHKHITHQIGSTRWRRSHRGSVRVKSKPLPPPKGLWLEKKGGGSQEDLEMEDLETAEDEKDYYFEDPSNIGNSW